MQVVVPRLEALLVAGDLVGASSEGPGRGGGATLSDVTISGISCASPPPPTHTLPLSVSFTVRRCVYDSEGVSVLHCSMLALSREVFVLTCS